MSIRIVSQTLAEYSEFGDKEDDYARIETLIADGKNVIILPGRYTFSTNPALTLSGLDGSIGSCLIVKEEKGFLQLTTPMLISNTPAVITESNPNLVSNQALLCGQRFGSVILAPAEENNIIRAGKAKIASLDYPLKFIPGNWGFSSEEAAILGYPDFYQLRILTVGDSRTIGNSRAGWRRILWQLARQSGRDIQMIGSVNIDGTPITQDGYAFTLNDLRHSGYSGETWADMTSSIGTRVIVSGQPNVVLVDLGTNDCLKHNPIEAIKADALAGIASIRAECQTAIIIWGTLNPLTGDEPAEALRAQYNEWMLTLNGTMAGVKCVDIASSLTADDLVDNVNPNPRGNAIIARAWLNEINKCFPITPGLPVPRILAPRSATGSLKVVNSAADYGLALNTTTARREGEKNYVVSFWHCPHLLDSTVRNLINYGTDYTHGWQLTINDGISSSVGLWVKGEEGFIHGQVFSTGAVPFFSVDNWIRFTLAFFTQTSASDERPCVALFANGRLLKMMHIGDWSDDYIESNYINVGYGAGIVGSQGLFDDISIAKWTGAPYFDNTREIIERDYFEGASIPNRTVHWTCDNSGVDTFGAASMVVGGTASFIAAGGAGFISKPCDG